MIALGKFYKKSELLDLSLKLWASCETIVLVNDVLFVFAEETWSMRPNGPRTISNASVDAV